MNTIDLDSPPPNHSYTVTVNPDETLGERRVRLTKDLMVFFLAVGFVVVVAYLVIATVVSGTAGSEEKKWAMSILSAGTGGLVGYLVRK